VADANARYTRDTFRNQTNHRYDIWTPRTPDASGTKCVVFYLPSTFCEQPKESWFQGHEIVVSPQVAMPKSRYPWRQEMPEWIVELFVHLQKEYALRCTQEHSSLHFGLVGFSRGASWGLRIATESQLTFSKVLLLAPYVLPMYKAESWSGVPTIPTKLRDIVMVIWGTQDPWLQKSESKGLVDHFSKQLPEDRCILLKDRGHDATLDVLETHWGFVAAFDI